MQLERSACEVEIVCRGKKSNQRRGHQGITALPPSFQSALQRPNAPYAFASKEQRHTGAGGFVWSSTIKNDFSIARQAVIFLFQILGIHAKRARNCMRVGLEVQGVP
jgi:hypothetical protein